MIEVFVWSILLYAITWCLTEDT